MESPPGAIEPTTSNLLKIDAGKLSINDKQRDYIISLYDGNILFADHMARDIFEFLEERKILDDTIVFVSSDHGEAFQQHGRMLHNTTVFDEMIHIPLLIHFPKALKLEPKRLSHPASVVDIAPTLAEIYDLPDVPEFSGTSLLPAILSDSASNPHAFIYSETLLTKARAIRDRSYKYLAQEKKMSKLFDLVNDPLEQKDLRNIMPVTAGYYQQLIEPFLGHPPLTHAIKATEPLNDEVIQNLKDLGYIK